MKQLMKYVIEFFVIVLGVSVSFLAEQWRQDINDRQEVEDLFRNVRHELELFKDYDSMYQAYSPESVLKKILFEESIEVDSFLRSFGLIAYQGELKNRFPSLYLLSYRKALKPDQLSLVEILTEHVDYLTKLDADNKLKADELDYLFDKYEILDDILKLYQYQLDKTREEGELQDWNPAKFGVERKGNYQRFVKDKDARSMLKIIYANVIERQIIVLDMKQKIDSFFTKNNK
jgi:hypothetical protein